MKLDRIEKLQKELVENDISCALLMYHRDVYYYAGTARPATLVVTPRESVLFCRRARDLTCQESRVRDIRLGGLSAIMEWIAAAGLAGEQVGVEMDLLPANMYLRLKDLLPGFIIMDVSPLILKQRLTKDQEEIEYIRMACRVAESAHNRLPEVLRPGMTELELAAELERAARLAGHETFAILRKRMETEMGYALVLGGESTKTIGGYGQVVTGNGLSRAFPYGPSNRSIEREDVVVFDIAGLSNGYHSDLARTYFLSKSPSLALEAHAALLAVQSTILSAARPGAVARDIYDSAVRTATEYGWQEYFQGPEEQRGTFVGHGLGLEIDEPPLLSPKDETVLRENMTFTTELFIVHPSFGEVKLEDTVLVTEDGTELMTRIERRVFEI
jgi:Xaa-Pro aminopeptidase